MKNNKLSNDELAQLHTFMKSVDHCVTYAHGFLCGVISSPDIIPTGIWLDDLFGGEPGFNDLNEANHMLGLLMRLNNMAADQLLHDRLELLLWNNKQKVSATPQHLPLVREWCEGYHDALEYFIDDEIFDEESFVVLLPSLLLTERLDPETLKAEDQKLFEDLLKNKDYLQKGLPKSVQLIYNIGRESPEDEHDNLEYYDDLEGDEDDFENVIPFHSNKVGRNEPCPCASGKKFKKCCYMSPATIH